MWRIIRFLGCLILAFALLGVSPPPVAATGEPDLQPTQILATAYTGISNTVSVFVANNEDVAVSSFNVLLEVDDGSGSGYATVDNISGNSILGNLDPWYAETQVKFSWTPPAAGDYTLKATVDSSDNISETVETNNEITQPVTVTDLTDITVKVRVEGSTATVWSGEVTFSTSSITDKEGTTHSIDHPTALGALDAAATAGGFSYVVSSAWGPLSYIEEVAGEAQVFEDPYPGWKYRVNWIDADVAAVDYTLSDGDEVLWYYGVYLGSQPLRLTLGNTSLPATENLTATVQYYDDDISDFVLLADATLHAGERIYTTDANGQVNVSLPPGAYNVYADKGNYTQYTRSNTETVIVYVTLTLRPGWNFISMPKRLISDNCTASEVFAGVNTDGRSIWYYTSGEWSAMSADTIVSPLEGIWIYSTSTRELRPQFDPDPRQVPPTKPLTASWNAIGFSDFTAAPANSTLISVESQWSTLIGYNSENQTYESSIINNDITGGPHDEGQYMYPWKGYWLYMTSAGELAGIGS